MEASGTPTPGETPAPPAPPPPPPVAPPAGEEKASGGWRLLAFILAVVFLGLAAVMIVVPLNPDNLPRCEQNPLVECIDQSKTSQTLQNIFAWPAGIVAAVAALFSFGLAFTGRGSNRLRPTAIAAIVLAVVVFAIPRVF